eukprot:TRINITY_DN5556_c0_g2_i7.p3 TRINITY_DN5556_c0_g2~~TRINITY_DN5556_c0_g2_i7.p3  ORF type:complete len:113 (-),score=21.04 TRINITY_DN5556_c0_g2_i7:48-386(-)
MREQVRDGYRTSHTVRHCSLCEHTTHHRPYIFDPETKMHLSIRKKNLWKQINQMEKENDTTVVRTIDQKRKPQGDEIIVYYPCRQCNRIPNVEINHPIFLTNGKHPFFDKTK